MKRIAWLTDIHLEFFPSSKKINTFCESIMALAPDCVLIGGDTGIAPSVKQYLLLLEKQLPLSIYFVLGNHDFYRGSIQQGRTMAASLTQTSQRLRWLTAEGIVELTPTTALIGHEGWADGRLGDGLASRVQLNDYFLIAELRGLSVKERFEKLKTLGDEAAEHFQKVLPLGLNRFQHVLLLTHVPPFKEACWHEGGISNDEYLPHFTCKAVGDVLIEVMKAHPESTLTVLCGHTHGQGEAAILPNLYVKTGGADYGEPKVQEVINVA